MAQEPQVIGLACGSSHSLALLGETIERADGPLGAAAPQPPPAAHAAVRPAAQCALGAP